MDDDEKISETLIVLSTFIRYFENYKKYFVNNSQLENVLYESLHFKIQKKTKS